MMYKILYTASVLFYTSSHGFSEETYDFIIVGIGSAGSVLVNRLSVNPEFSVLGLEEGGYANPILSHIPAYAGAMVYSENNYRYTMEKQPNMSLGLKQQRLLYSAGKGLGGTSLINMMLDVMPNRKDFDRWAKLGNTGWDSQSMLKYTREFETAEISYLNPNYRGTTGPLGVQELRFRTKGVETFLQASKEMNMYINPDYNGERQQEGAGHFQVTTRNGLRCDAYTAFVKPISKRRILRIRIFCKVVKILIDPETKKAYGVVYFQFTTFRYRKAYAKKEVIISAGAFNSPKLLMLSGIGPKNHLQSMGIKVIQDLPVGEYMEDHITFPGVVFKTKKKVGVDVLWSVINPLNYVKLLENKENILSVPTLAFEGVGFLYTNISSENRDIPNIELVFVSQSLNSDRGLLLNQFFGISIEMYKVIYKPLENHYTWMVLPALYQPKSHGWVKLKSKNPFDPPLLYGNFYTDKEETDMKTMITAIRYCQKLGKTQAFKEFGSQQVIPVIPGCEDTSLDSDAYWECFLRHISVSFWHNVGTCKMGSEDDKTAIVDPQLQVYGIKNLRVIDNSIGPLVPGCHSNPLAMLIAYKGSDMILQKYL